MRKLSLLLAILVLLIPALAIAGASFQAYMSADQDFDQGTTTTVQFDSEVFDVGGRFNTGTYTLTHPGEYGPAKYQLNVIVRLENLDTETCTYWYVVSLVTSNRTYSTVFDVNKRSSLPNINYHTLAFSVVADLDPTDTAYVTVRQEGDCSPPHDVSNIGIESWFSGFEL